jgi:hypothetical protein
MAMLTACSRQLPSPSVRMGYSGPTSTSSVVPSGVSRNRQYASKYSPPNRRTSGPFSSGKYFSKAGSVVLTKKFTIPTMSLGFLVPF